MAGSHVDQGHQIDGPEPEPSPPCPEDQILGRLDDAVPGEPPAAKTFEHLPPQHQARCRDHRGVEFRGGVAVPLPQPEQGESKAVEAKGNRGISTDAGGRAVDHIGLLSQRVSRQSVRWWEARDRRG